MEVLRLLRENAETIRNVLLLLIFVVMVMLAYNIGHYDSLQYQKWFETCGGRINMTPDDSWFNGSGVNLNISGRR